MKKIIVASKNPVKINAALEGFLQMFSGEQFEASGVAIASDVADQPMSDRETYKGALNRATKAAEAYPDADYWVGIEGGIEVKDNELATFAWIVIKSATITGKSRTATFFLPPEIVELVQAGKELGHAADSVFGKTNIKQNNGTIGILTDDVTTRTEFYAEAVVLALIPFKNETLYLA